LAAVFLMLAACSSSTPAGGSATPDPSLAFCPALDAYEKALIRLDGLTPEVTVADFKKAAADAKVALAALVAVSGPYVGAQLNALQTAQNDLDYAAAQLGPATTPAQAETALEPLLQAVIQEGAATRNAICNTRPTPSAS
jgi:hypothetical protein